MPRYTKVWVWMLGLCVGCVGSGQVECDNGKVCPAGYTCSSYGCLSPEQLIACAGHADAETCETARGPGVCADGACLVSTCGNAIVEGLEVCDDGNTFSGDGCDGTCRSDETCGNGIAELAEECDCGDAMHPGPASCAGTSNGADQCSETCMRRACGNDVVDPGEVCDDGNLISGDDCSADCKSNETCGNGYVDFAAGELCEDGDDQTHDGCGTCQTELPVWTFAMPGAPTARRDAAAAYDAARGKVVLFGGQDSAVFLADTWEWDGRTWKNVTPPAGSPSVRGRHAMAYDASRRRIVMFGGFAGAGAIFNDTWEWNGAAWENVTPPTGSPAIRSYAAMTYDAARKRVVMFGGDNTSGQLADTWEWDGTTWTNVTPAGTSPSARRGSAMAFDAARGRVVLFGGDPVGSFLGDTWEWTGSAWLNVTPGAGSPPARARHAMAYDAVRGRVIVVAGLDTTGTALGDVWEWSGSAWTNKTPASGNPTARSGHGLTYDSIRGRIVLVTGNSAGGLLADAWEWNGSAWSDATPSAQVIGARATANALVYDSKRGRVIMYGGDQTWAWDGRAWTDVTPSSGNPSTRTDYTIAYDAKRDRVVLFGGSGMNDTWEFNGTVWMNVTPGSGNPSARSSHAMTYDAARGRVVMFGGSAGSVVNDTWEWDGSAWTNKTPGSGNPAARQGHALAYDAARGRVVLFGGLGATSAIGYLNDTWEWDGTTWTNRTPTAGLPGVRRSSAMTYDATHGRVVVFGGVVGVSPLADTWEWDGTVWADVTPATGPSPRTRVGMAYDAAHAQIVLFGGVGATTLADTWLYRYTTSAPDDGCVFGIDGDGDGKLGCADPDCFGFCSPLCNPTLMTCDPTSPNCGDGTCQQVETKQLCPADCGAPSVVCGDFLCESPETMVSCPGDCP